MLLIVLFGFLIFFIWLLFLLKLKIDKVDFFDNVFLFFFSRKTFLIPILLLLSYFLFSIVKDYEAYDKGYYYIRDFVNNKFYIILAFFIISNFFYKNDFIINLYNLKVFSFIIFVYLFLPEDLFVIDYYTSEQDFYIVLLIQIVILSLLYYINKIYLNKYKMLFFIPIFFISFNIYLDGKIKNEKKEKILNLLSFEKNKKEEKFLTLASILIKENSDKKEKELKKYNLDIESVFSKINKKEEIKAIHSILSFLKYFDEKEILIFVHEFTETKTNEARVNFVLNLIPDEDEEKFWEYLNEILKEENDYKIKKLYEKRKDKIVELIIGSDEETKKYSWFLEELRREFL